MSCKSFTRRLYVLGNDTFLATMVSIFGDSDRSISRIEPLILHADTYIATCDHQNSKSISNIMLTWSIKQNNGLFIDSITSTSNDPGVFKMPSYSFESSII